MILWQWPNKHNVQNTLLTIKYYKTKKCFFLFVCFQGFLLPFRFCCKSNTNFWVSTVDTIVLNHQSFTQNSKPLSLMCICWTLSMSLSQVKSKLVFLSFCFFICSCCSALCMLDDFRIFKSTFNLANVPYSQQILQNYGPCLSNDYARVQAKTSWPKQKAFLGLFHLLHH